MAEPDESQERILDLMADDPIGGTGRDRLDRVQFAARMAQVFEHASAQSPSVVFGLLGPWGSGKTSVLRLVRDVMAEARNWKIVEFNPWEASDLSSVVREFMLTVRSAMPPGDRGDRLRSVFSRYTRKIAPITSMLSVMNVDPSRAVEALADLIGGEDSLEGLRDDLVKQLLEHDQRVLVLIDDVDRLQADELTLVLKLVRLVGRLPNLYYVLAYDESTVLDVLESTDVASEQRQRALAYLDKIVQVRLDLPPVHPTRTAELVDAALEQVTSQYEIEVSEAEARRLGRVYHSHLKATMREPRQVKRFFGQVDALLPLVLEEVNFVDFLLVTFLRTFFPQVHSILTKHKDELTGTAMELGSRKVTPENRMKWWQERILAAAPGADVDVVLGVLGELFSPIGNAMVGYSGRGTGSLAKDRRVGSSEYFDRYFHLGIASDDVGDAEVRSALSEVLAGRGDEAERNLRPRLARAAEPLFDKLARFSPEDGGRCRVLLPWAIRMQANAPEQGMLGRSRIAASFWAAEMMKRADLSEPEVVLASCLGASSLEQVVSVTRRMVGSMRSDGQEVAGDHATFVALVIQRLRQALEDATAVPLEDNCDWVASYLYGWRDLDGPEEARAWLRGVIERCRWSVEDVTALFVSVGRIIGTDIYRLSGWDEETLNELLGFDFALARFHPPTTLPTPHWNEEVEPTFEVRREHAVASLARRAAAAVWATEDSPG